MRKVYRSIFIAIATFMVQYAFAQTRISGKITNANTGEALFGATIKVQDTSIGEVADANGNFTLESDSPLPWNLIINFTGYVTERVVVTSSGQTVNVKMKSGTVLQDVIVTAQKRPQNPIEVPIAMTVVTGNDISKNGTSNITEMAVMIPNVDVNTGFAAPTLSVRGITTSGTNVGMDQSVATFIDGFYAGRPQMVLSPFLDVEQVEILKGPQPTFFGQSTIGGALSTVTRKPGRDGEGFATVSGGSQSEYNVEAGYTIRPSDQFGVRLAGKYNSFGGFLEETKTGDFFGGFQQYAGRISAEWKPSDRFDATVKVELNERAGDGTGIKRTRDSRFSPGDVWGGPDFVEASFGAVYAFDGADPNYQQYSSAAEEFDVNVGGDQPLPTSADGAFGFFLNPFVAAEDVNPDDPSTFTIPYTIQDLSDNPLMQQTGNNDGNQNVNSDVYQLSMNYKAGDYAVQSITSSGGFESSTWLDIDMSRYALMHVNGVVDYAQFSQELRLISPDNQTFNWMVGAYYQKSEISANNRVYQANFGTLAGARLDEESEWMSFFASASYNVASKLFIEGGIRYSDVSKRADQLSISGMNADGSIVSATELANGVTPATWGVVDGIQTIFFPSFYDQQFNTDNTNPSISLLWKDTRQTYYLKYANGFKTGGFSVGNNIDADALSFKDETANSFELGLKAVNEDFTFRYNVALFRTNYEDLQISAFDNTTSSFIVTNAGNAITQGLELDAQWFASDMFNLGFDFAITDAEFDDFNTEANSDEVAAFEAGLVDNVTPLDNENDGMIDSYLVDRSGYELKFSPDYQFTIRSQLFFQMSSDYHLSFGANISYRDDYQTGDNYYNSDQQEAHELIDLTLGYAKKDDAWGVSCYARNITNRYYLTVSNDSTFIPGRNARFGLQARVKF